MTVTTVRCDKCGGEINPKDKHHVFVPYQTLHVPPPRDLCHNCAFAFIELILRRLYTWGPVDYAVDQWLTAGK